MTEIKATEVNTETALEQNLIKRKKEKVKKRMSLGAMEALEQSKEVSKIETAKIASAENHYDCGAFVRLPSNRGK